MWFTRELLLIKRGEVKTLQTPRQAFLAGLSTGLKPPTARGPRFASVHTGNENGPLPSAQLVFLCEKNTADAHVEMDDEIYEQYLKDQALSNLPPGSVIVLDNASHHSRRVETIPTVSRRKDKIQEWITSHVETFEECMLKKHLMETVNRVRPKYDKYKIDEMAQEMSHTVLRLPPYHCELNPIELV
jgi:transposase